MGSDWGVGGGVMHAIVGDVDIGVIDMLVNFMTSNS